MENECWKNQPVIMGEKVRLRPIEMEDTDRIVHWRNTPSVRQNFIFRQPFTREMHNGWMKNKVATGQVIQYIIETAGDQRPIGSVYLRDIDWENSCAEYGIFIGEEEARGHGIGTETACLFVKYGFETLGLHRIYLRLLKGNEPAYHAYQKAGFVQEGLFQDMVRLEGEYCDVIFMAVLRTEEEEDEF